MGMGREASEPEGRQSAGSGEGRWALRPPPPPAARPPLRPRPPSCSLALSRLAAAGAGRAGLGAPIY